jgi:hypothetical protein
MSFLETIFETSNEAVGYFGCGRAKILILNTLIFVTTCGINRNHHTRNTEQMHLHLYLRILNKINPQMYFNAQV